VLLLLLLLLLSVGQVPSYSLLLLGGSWSRPQYFAVDARASASSAAISGSLCAAATWGWFSSLCDDRNAAAPPAIAAAAIRATWVCF